MRRILPLILLLWLPAAPAFTPELASLARTPAVLLEAAPIAQTIAASKSEPRRYAVGQILGSDVRHGAWDAPAPGIARWRLRLRSDGAQSMSLRLEDLQLPAGAQLWIYGADGADVQGPYDSADNGTLWTPLVRAAEAVIEARMPSEQQTAFALRVAEAFHGYRDPARAARDKSFAYDPSSDSGNGAAGACNIDVACAAADAWRDEARSTVLLTIGNGSACTGTLVNTTAQDDRPLVLTANHCGIGAGNVEATIAYFNVERGACGSGSYGSVAQNLHGQRLLASNRGADYALFELDGTPPPSFDAYYAGWDAGSAAPLSGAAIHHPSVDDKKISLFERAATPADNVGFGSFTAARTWAVVWSAGTTEPGSSGGALWNQTRRVVGMLSGGDSTCSNPDGEDFYARLDHAWTASSTTGATLGSILDACANGTRSLSGKNPGPSAAAPAVQADAATVTENSVAAALDVLANDEPGLSLVAVTAPAHGSATIDTANQVIRYTPAANFSGSDSFSYRARGSRACDTATTTVTITVAAPAQPSSGGGGSLGPALLLVCGLLALCGRCAAAAAGRRARATPARLRRL